jgi:thiol-disulfide isomerase/thioredoxin
VSQRGRVRVRAPELTGRGGWINTGGKSYTLGGLRGRFVLLDFWSFCCVNCLHVVDELRDIETKYADELVVVGVHSPKFEHEGDHDAVEAAVARYRVHHPVLDDPDLTTWDAYAVRAWPTLVLIDPEGYVVAQFSGEGHAHALAALLDILVAEHRARGTLVSGDRPYHPIEADPTTLRFPAKVIALPGGTLLVADAGHHGLAELAADGETLVRRIGSGRPGRRDGPADLAELDEPNGLCLLPAGVVEQVGYDVVVADTVNHLLRGVRLDTGEVSTLAGTGRQWMQGDPRPAGPTGGSDGLSVAGSGVGSDGASVIGSTAVSLSSPWDVAWHPGWSQVAIAMAGIHQIWSFDPVARTLAVRGGTTNEGLRDGPAGQAWFAQPSGLAVDATDPDGPLLWLVDSETSSLRSLRGGVVLTHVGRGLFDFGHLDGDAADALLQHPLGVTVLPDSSVAVLDTYNGAVRRYDPATREVSTIVAGLREPSGSVLVPGAGTDRPDLLVVESGAHRLTRCRLPDRAVAVPPKALRTRRPELAVAPGPFELAVVFDPPPGQKLDDRYGPSTRLVVSASPPELLVGGAGSGPELVRSLTLAPGIPAGVLHVAGFAASCDDIATVEYPACHVHQQDWGVPVTVRPDGANRLALMLGGLDQ